MKKFDKIKRVEVFHGEEYILSNKNYFEGWYFKNTCGKTSMAFIPGISINEDRKIAFIQVITNDNSYFIEYNINDFVFNHEPFFIKIKDNYFSKDTIKLNIEDKASKLSIGGLIKYSDSIELDTSIFMPNIMGPFTYLKFMECNHAIITMRNRITGKLKINNKLLKLNDGIGYIEKDWGVSFPKEYLWCQAHDFKEYNASLMLAIADVPLKSVSFTGFICVLLVDDVEYRFTSYNGAKVVTYGVSDDSELITIKRGRYQLNITIVNSNVEKLLAPNNGRMNREIYESVTASIKATLIKNDEVIFEDVSINAGLEKV